MLPVPVVGLLHVGEVLQAKYHQSMSPTVFRDGPFRFYFFSREESRMHIHVQAPDGEAKFWLEPKIELAMSVGLTRQQVDTALALVRKHEHEIRAAWKTHFGS